MAATRDRFPAQAPRPFTPKLATSSSNSFSRSPPKPRLAAQTSTTSVTAAIQARRPLPLTSSPPKPRPNPLIGRSTPLKSACSPNIHPRSNPRLANVEITPSSAMTKPPATTYTPPSSATRPNLTRGLTTPSLPAPSGRPTLHPKKSSASFVAGHAVKTTSPLSSRPTILPGRIQTSPHIQCGSFFHADEVPLRSTSPEPASLSSMVNFVYASATERHPIVQLDINRDNTVIPQLPRSTSPGRYPPSTHSPFSDPISIFKPMSPALTSTLVHSAMPQLPTIPGPSPISTNDAKKISLDSESTSMFPSVSTSKRLSNNGQFQQFKADAISDAPSHRKSRSTSNASSAPVSNPFDAKNPKPLIRSGARSSRNSNTPTEPSSPLLSSSIILDSLGKQQPVGQIEDPTQHRGTAASARHERKLLDLEISNSSLLAINRTLEREVAKQKAELKRLRRNTVDRTSGNSDGMEDSSEVGSVLSIDADPENISDEYNQEKGVTKRPSNDRRNFHRKLLLDYSKHREILEDSQKMNVALQGCLATTDQLIQDGDKALEYQVYASDLGDETGHPVDEFENKPLPQIYSTFNVDNNKPSAAESFFQTWGTLSLRTSLSHTDVKSESTDRDSGIDVGYTATSGEQVSLSESN